MKSLLKEKLPKQEEIKIILLFILIIQEKIFL